MIGRSGERGSGISVLAERHDDDEVLLSMTNYLYTIIWFLYDDNNHLFEYGYMFLSNSSYLIICLHKRVIGLISRVFANGPGDQGSIPGRVISKTQKMVLDASLLKTQHYRIRFKGKMEQSRERSGAQLGVIAIEKEVFGSPPTKVTKYLHGLKCLFLFDYNNQLLAQSYLLSGVSI